VHASIFIKEHDELDTAKADGVMVVFHPGVFAFLLLLFSMSPINFHNDDSNPTWDFCSSTPTNMIITNATINGTCFIFNLIVLDTTTTTER